MVPMGINDKHAMHVGSKIVHVYVQLRVDIKYIVCIWTSGGLSVDCPFIDITFIQSQVKWQLRCRKYTTLLLIIQ